MCNNSDYYYVLTFSQKDKATLSTQTINKAEGNGGTRTKLEDRYAFIGFMRKACNMLPIMDSG